LSEHTNKTPTQQCYRQLDASIQKYRKKQENEGEHSGETKERWHRKRTHGQLPRKLDEKLVEIEQSHRWLKSGDIKGETESTIVAAQDQVISKTYFQNKILKEENDGGIRIHNLSKLVVAHPLLKSHGHLDRHQ